MQIKFYFYIYLNYLPKHYSYLRFINQKYFTSNNYIKLHNLLNYSCQYNHIGIIKFIIIRIVNNSYLFQKFNHYKYFTVAINYASQNGHINLIKLFINYNLQLDLYWIAKIASKYKQNNIVSYLVNLNFDNLNKLLLYCVEENYVDTINILNKKKLNI